MVSHMMKNTAPSVDEDAVYDVYIYHMPSNTNERIQDWERKASTLDPRRALLKAKVLHRSELYQKVEVKKREKHQRTKSVRTATLKTYEHKDEKSRKPWWGLGFVTLKA